MRISDRFIAAVAGSAGSLESFEAFFDHTLHDDVSYIIVRHLPAHFKSHLKTILSRYSKLDVVDARPGMVIGKDKIYVVPADMYMTVHRDWFRPDMERAETHRPVYWFKQVPRIQRINRSVDVLLTSMAECSGERAIAAIVSGTGDDGSLGVQHIKESGGFTLAQPPDTCDFSAMPANAIHTGCIDKIVSCDEMPFVIQEYVQRNLLLIPALSHGRRQ